MISVHNGVFLIVLTKANGHLQLAKTLPPDGLDGMGREQPVGVLRLEKSSSVAPL